MKRVGLAFAVFVVWLLITIIGGSFTAAGGTELIDMVKNGIGWHFVTACLFLIVAIRLFGWRDISFRMSWFPGDLGLYWLPILYIVGMGAFGITVGLAPTQTLVYLFINTMLVGFSEEVALRGVVYFGLRARLSTFAAVTVTTILFGSMHALNAFQTGDLTVALVQSLTAAMSGLVFMAVMLRSRSIVPAILLHGLWDFCTFLLVSSPSSTPPETTHSVASLVAPMLFVVPNFVYGLFLMRKVENQAPVGA